MGVIQHIKHKSAVGPPKLTNINIVFNAVLKKRQAKKSNVKTATRESQIKNSRGKLGRKLPALMHASMNNAQSPKIASDGSDA